MDFEMSIFKFILGVAIFFVGVLVVKCISAWAEIKNEARNSAANDTYTDYYSGDFHYVGDENI